MVKYTASRVPVKDIQVAEYQAVVPGSLRKLPSCWIVFLAGLFIKATLVLRFPALYGGDTVFHLRNHQHLLLSHQLPMLQMMIFLTYKVTSVPLVFRFVMVVIGALSGVGFYLLCRRLTNPETASWAALFFVTNPFLNEVSIVPFQEMLMLGALCFALYFYFEDRFPLAALVYAFACLTRQEAWLICPMLIIDYSKRRHSRAKDVFAACAMFGCAPMLWVAVHLGLSSPGTYTLEFPHTLGRFVRWIYLAWVCVKQTPVPVLALAFMATLTGHRDGAPQKRGLIFFTGVLALYMLAILSAAHGIGHPGMPNPELFISAREATLLVGVTLLLSAFGIHPLLKSCRWKRPTTWTAGFGVLLGLVQSAFLVASQTSEPHTSLSYQVAAYLQANASANEEILVVATPFTPDDWNYFIQKASQLQGEKGAAAARLILRESDLSPMDLQRTAIQTSLPQDCFVTNVDPVLANWLLIWNDVAQPVDVIRALKLFHQVRELRAGRLAVAIWRK